MKTLICVCIALLFITVSKPIDRGKVIITPMPQLNSTDSLYKAVLRLEESTRKLEKYTK